MWMKHPDLPQTASTPLQVSNQQFTLVWQPREWVETTAPVGAADLYTAELLTRTVGDGRYMRPAAPTVIIFGDSLTNQNNGGPPTLDGAGTGDVHGRGYWSWASAMLGQRWALVRNAGVGGNTTTQMLARLQADVLAYPSGWVIVCGGGNDIGTLGLSAAQVETNLTEIITGLRAAGRRVLLMTIPPSSAFDTLAKRQAWMAVNAWIRDLPLTYLGLVVADITPAVADPATAAAATGMTVDGVHWSIAGAHRVGRIVADALTSYQPPRPPVWRSVVDAKMVLGAPGFAGGAGSWPAVGTTNPLNTVITFPALSDRWGAGARLVVGPGVADNEARAVQYIEDITGGRYAVGDIVQAAARFKVSNAVWITAGLTSYQPLPFLRIWPRKADNSFGTQAQGLSCPSSESAVATAGMPTDFEVIALTSRLTIPATTTRLYLAAGIAGMASGQVDISDFTCWKA